MTHFLLINQQILETTGPKRGVCHIIILQCFMCFYLSGLQQLVKAYDDQQPEAWQEDVHEDPGREGGKQNKGFKKKKRWKKWSEKQQ